MLDRATHDTSNCSIARSLGVLGERWTFLILREAWYGVTRFSDLEQVLGCARNLLASRLQMLVREGILTREPYHLPGERARSHYVLTDKGEELVPALVALMEWGDRHLADPAGEAVRAHHHGCGHRVRVEMRCEAGHRVHRASEIDLEPGPGFRLLSGRVDSPTA
jgi:DNA-binding HxlR family transcriptional regulator